MFDLAIVSGLRNAAWRTPGPDTGRDIEGDFYHVDLSGHHCIVRWYVECKRYDKSVDWPTVWEKLAYAQNHNADSLLVVTTASLSPQCKSEVNRHNDASKRPSIRFWDATNLEHVAVRYPVVLLKHGIASDPQLNATSLLQLAIASSKVVQAAYGHAEFAGQYNPALESASALSELLTYWLVKAESAVTHSISRFELEIDGYDWLNVSGPRELLSRFDKHGLRAMLSTLRHICNVSTLSGDAGEGELLIAGIGNLSSGAESAIRELAVWSDIEIVIQKDSMTLRPGGLSE